jgi:ABC-2 type transport system permease protein
MSSPFLLTAAALWSREMRHFWRDRHRVFGFAASPLVFWLLIGSGFGNLTYYFPGALLLSVVFTAVFSTMSVIDDRREGFLLAVLVSPAPRSAVATGKLLGGATMAAAQGLLFFLFLPLAGIPFAPLNLLAATGVLFLVSLLSTALGFLLAWRSSSTQGFHAIMNLLLLPLWLVSGAVFPPDKAHGWMQWAMRANPLTYALAALERSLAPAVSWSGPSLTAGLAVTAAATFLLSLASVRAVTASRT